MHAHTHTRANAHTHACAQAHTRHTHTVTHTDTHTHTHACAQAHTHLQVCKSLQGTKINAWVCCFMNNVCIDKTPRFCIKVA